MTQADFKMELPQWYDLHTHIRQGDLMAPIVQSQIAMGCCGFLAMPNTKPPVAKVFESDPLDCWSIEAYTGMLRAAGGGGLQDIIVPLYLSRETTPEMIMRGAKAGVLRACKYYPPHGTTGAEFGYPFEHFMENGVFAAMQDCGVVLCIHGEEHHLPGAQYFAAASNAEDIFYKKRMPTLVERFPALKVACEHVTTRTAVDFVSAAGPQIAASITPQHLLYTIGDLLQGLKYHLFCLPLLKFEEDRAALRLAVLDRGNTRFYAGTDSAAHTRKATECGCAAGCFTGGIAPQLYAQAFEDAGVSLETPDGQAAFERFLCHNGPAFYNLSAAAGRFTLVRKAGAVQLLSTPEGEITPLPLGLGQDFLPWSIQASDIH
ncbi:MAG: dihydroorotase [Alphaproteobacteria bacterium]|nr:dihydroorotase [Alphaproteobacteria bacterium]